MAVYKKFEDLPVWQKAKELTVLVYQLTDKTNIKKDFGLRDQIQRSAVSVSSNIAEGFERGSKLEFIQFLYISRGSCGELRSHLCIAKGIGYLQNNDFDLVYDLALNISKQINGFIEYLKGTKKVGQKSYKSEL